MAVREPPVEQGGRRSRAMPTSRRDVSGWIVFASVVLIVAGFMRVFDAIWAFR